MTLPEHHDGIILICRVRRSRRVVSACVGARTVQRRTRRVRGETADMTKKISGGVPHDLPADLRQSLSSDPKALAAWEALTPLARNEWICWVISVKTPETRREHVERVSSELNEGMRRPCCWMGCVHRRDKPLSPSQKYLLGKRSKK